MSSGYINLPVQSGAIPYPSASDFPATASDGALAVALDTDTLYVYNAGTTSWIPIATPGAAIAIDALTGDATATGPGAVPLTLATVNSNVGSFGSASKAVTLSVNGKGLTTAVAETNIQIAESQVTNLVSDLASKQDTLTIGNLTDAGTDGITVTGGTGAVIGSGTSIAQHVSDSTHNGYLSSSDWTTFNNKLGSANTTAKVIFVSQDTGNDSNSGTYFSPLKTIQAGINKAELIAAYYNQVIVNITPSSSSNGYQENLTMSQQGVTLQGYSPVTRSDSVLVKGNLTINLTGTSGGANFVAASNIVYIKGLLLTATSGNTLTFSGTTFQRLFLDECYLDNTGTGSAIVMTNTGVSGVSSTITANDSDINNNNATNPVVRISAGRFFYAGTANVIQNSNASGPSLIMDGASATGALASISECQFTGQVSVTDNLATCYLSQCTVASGSAAAISTPSSPNTGFVSLGNVGLTTTATNSIIGSGVLALLGQVVRLSTGGDVISTVTQVTITSLPQGPLMLGAGATQNTNTLLTLKNGHLTSQQSTAPTSALQTGAGTTATRTLTRCTDTAGNISITTNGTGIASGAQLIVTFNKSYATAPVVALTPANAAAAQLIGAYVTSSTTTFTINFATAGVATTAYAFTYQVIET